MDGVADAIRRVEDARGRDEETRALAALADALGPDALLSIRRSDVPALVCACQRLLSSGGIAADAAYALLAHVLHARLRPPEGRLHAARLQLLGVSAADMRAACLRVQWRDAADALGAMATEDVLGLGCDMVDQWSPECGETGMAAAFDRLCAVTLERDSESFDRLVAFVAESGSLATLPRCALQRMADARQAFATYLCVRYLADSLAAGCAGSCACVRAPPACLLPGPSVRCALPDPPVVFGSDAAVDAAAAYIPSGDPQAAQSLAALLHHIRMARE